MAKKRKPPEPSRVHPDLKGFAIHVDPLGEIRMNRSVEEISQFLKNHMYVSQL
ncbi:MAG: hypothetical protein IPJ06_17160 [Saprospiraceae bacterium]|nr:hypothetical protein [Saprospiraceae bacterium]